MTAVFVLGNHDDTDPIPGGPVAIVDSPEFVFVEYAADDLLPETDFASRHVAELNATTFALLSRALLREWAKVCENPVRMVDADTYRQMIDPASSPVDPRRHDSPAVHHDTIVLVPAEDTAVAVWRAAIDSIEFDDIVRHAGLSHEYSAFARSQPDYDL